MAECLVCKRDLGYTAPLPIVTAVEKLQGRKVTTRSNGARKDFRTGYYGHGCFCTKECAGSYGLRKALDEKAEPLPND